ncbi:hypothetical protein GIB67_001459 [Kingdonia uniflora]|uniref:Transposase MuDR plant domain-containing protein n=1 Tax=Kingdonia uniflora TaxID=39325 RepID=A0A7J7L6Z1_9MAGN|nr:hypothetical protein GIB67_001459 [Kingdonia uniflora]
MNGVQLYTIAHFGGDIIRPKIGSIVSYVGRSMKLTSLRDRSSYEDFVTLLEETNEIRREDWLSTTKDTSSGKCLSTSKVGGPLRHNSFPDPESEYRGYPETSGRGLNPRRFGPFVDDDDAPQSNDSFETICTDVPPSNKLSIPQSNVHLSNEPVLTNVPQSYELFQTIPTNVPHSNEPSIPQLSIHLSNEPLLTNVLPLNEHMLTNVPLSIEPEPLIGQTKTSVEFWLEPQPEQVKDLLDFRFKSVAYIEDPYDFIKEFNIGYLYQDRIELKNHIRAYAVINKFNLEHVLSNEYKIVVRCKGQKCSWRIYATRLLGSALFRVSTYCSAHTCIQEKTESGNAYKAASSRWVASLKKQNLPKDPNYKPSRIIDNMQIHHNIDVTYNLAGRAKEKAHAETRRPPKIEHSSWRCLGLTFAVMTLDSSSSLIGILELLMLYPREEAEKSQARLTPWATDHCEGKKFVADLLTCRVYTSRHHFQMTSYGRTNFVNIEDGTCSCRWWQTIGIPFEQGVRALGLANIDPTTRVFEYFTNNTYKVVYEPI